MTTLYQVSEILTRGADSRIRHKSAAANADPMDQKDPCAYVAQLKKTRLSGFVRLYRTRAGQGHGRDALRPNLNSLLLFTIAAQLTMPSGWLASEPGEAPIRMDQE